MTVGHDSSFDHVPRSRSPYPSTLVHEPSLVDWGERARGSPEEGSSPCGAGYPPAARATLAPCPAASRRAPPGASGPPRSRSEARRTSGSNGYRHGSSDAHAHDACPKRHPGMHAACPRRIAEDGRPTRAVTSGEEPAAAPSDGRGIGRSGRRRSLAAAGKRDRRYFRSTFPQHPDEHRPERGFSSQSITVGSQRPQRARSA